MPIIFSVKKDLSTAGIFYTFVIRQETVKKDYPYSTSFRTSMKMKNPVIKFLDNRIRIHEKLNPKKFILIVKDLRLIAFQDIKDNTRYPDLPVNLFTMIYDRLLQHKVTKPDRTTSYIIENFEVNYYFNEAKKKTKTYRMTTKKTTKKTKNTSETRKNNISKNNNQKNEDPRSLV